MGGEQCRVVGSSWTAASMNQVTGDDQYRLIHGLEH